MIFAIVAAAGHGLRFGGKNKKQFLPLAGKPVFIQTLSVFEASEHIDQIVCVVPKEDLLGAKRDIADAALHKVAALLPGGAHRQDSVAAALAFLEKTGDADDSVLVHDGVRPLVSLPLISKVVAGVARFGAAVAAYPVTDSLKEVSEDLTIQGALSRSRIWAMQTPQGFRLSMLSAAYRKGAEDRILATDEATLVTRLGHTIHCIESTVENIKITRESDLALAEYLLQRRDGLKSSRPPENPLPQENPS